MKKTVIESKRAKRGFGLIDVSLGIIAGIGLLVGAVIVFQQVNINSAVGSITQNATSISTELRSIARNMPTFNSLVNQATPAAGAIPLANLGFEPGILNNPTVTAAAAGATFNLVFTGLNARACQRAAAAPDNLGASVTQAVCASTTLTITYGR